MTFAVACHDCEETVYLSPHNHNRDVYHEHLDCPAAPEAPEVVSRDAVTGDVRERDQRRKCSKCGYDDVPVLEEAPPADVSRDRASMPAAAIILWTLFVIVSGIGLVAVLALAGVMGGGL